MSMAITDTGKSCMYYQHINGYSVYYDIYYAISYNIDTNIPLVLPDHFDRIIYFNSHTSKCMQIYMWVFIHDASMQVILIYIITCMKYVFNISCIL